MYLCLCPQIEPEEITSVLEKSFRAFNNKHGKGEVELNCPSRKDKKASVEYVSPIPRREGHIWRGLADNARHHGCHLQNKLAGETVFL